MKTAPRPNRTTRKKSVMESSCFKSGQFFTTGDIAELLDIAPNNAAHILDMMARDGVLDVRQTPNGNGSPINRYVRRMRVLPVMRKRSNESLGLEVAHG